MNEVEINGIMYTPVVDNNNYASDECHICDLDYTVCFCECITYGCSYLKLSE